jgi:hypothetical protein
VRGGRTGHGVIVDQGGLRHPTEMRKKIALKYCGGCDPGFDRVEYFNTIRTAIGNAIEWVTPDDQGVDIILVISGCDTACPERSIDFSHFGRIITIRNNDDLDLEEITETLLK